MMIIIGAFPGCRYFSGGILTLFLLAALILGAIVLKIMNYRLQIGYRTDRIVSRK